MNLQLPPDLLYTLLVVAVLIALDWALGAVAAAARGDFDLRLVSQFLQSHVLPYLGSLALLAGGSVVLGELRALFYAAAAAASTAHLVEIKDKLQAVFGSMTDSGGG